MIVVRDPGDDTHRLWLAMRLGLGASAFLNSCGSVGLERDGNVIAAVVYTNYETYRQTKRSCCWASIAAMPKERWATRGFIQAILEYPFDVLGVCVLRTMCARSNKQARAFNQKLGLRQVGRARRGWDGRADAMHYDMLPEDAEKWLGRVPTAWKEGTFQERLERIQDGQG